MSWLFPFYLLGAGAIIAPILMHLRKRPPKDRVEISSLMFLEASPRQPAKKRRLDHWLLLLLRCLVLILLALMFARPWFNGDSGSDAQSGEAVVVLIDQSASMKREDLWPRATEAASEIIAKLNQEDRCAVGLYHYKLMPVWTFSDDSSADTRNRRQEITTTRLAESAPSWHRTNLGAALIAAADRLTTSDVANLSKRRIHVISDFQSGTDLDALRAYAWPQEVDVAVTKLAVKDPSNLALALAKARRSAGSGDPAVPSATSQEAKWMRFRIENARDATGGDYSIGWSDESVATEGFLPPGVSRIVSSASPDIPGGILSATIQGDSHVFDNTVYLPPSQPATVRVLLVGSEADSNATASPLFYIKRALQPTEGLQPVLSTLDEAPISERLMSTDMAVLGTRIEDPAQLGALTQWVKAGGFLVCIADPKTLPNLLERPELKVTQANVADYQMIASVHETHPFTEPFRDNRLRDFTKVHFWKYRQIKGGADLLPLATFDNGDPAILLNRLGSGAVLIMTSGWHPADSQLALSTKFVPMIYGWLAGSGFTLESNNQITLGEALTITANDPTEVTSPSGESSILAPGNAMIAHEPGYYRLKSESGAKRTLAANLAPEEGRTSPMELTALSELGVTLADSESTSPSQVAVQASLAAAEKESQQRVWWYLLIGILALLASETWLANRRPQSAVAQPSTP